MVAASELTIDTGANATAMADAIFGDGVTVVNATYTGDNRSSGIFSDGDSVAPGVTPSDTGVMFSTGRLSGFTNSSGSANQNSNTTTGSRGPNNNAEFNALAGTSTYDASFIDVDIIPDDNIVTLQFVFSSEEYPEYAGSLYNDMIGVWVNGNPVDIVIGNGETSPGNISGSSNENLFVNNAGSDYNTEMDGFTVTMTVKMVVNPNVVNSIRIGIADVGDSSYDSTLLIAGNSGQTNLIAYDDSVTVGLGGTTTVDVVANDDGPGNSSLFVTHINGVAVSVGDTITLSTGQTVSLNADGTLEIVADMDEEEVNFSYTVATGGGSSNNSDTAFVTINSVPCFVAGTMIETTRGPVRVETLSPGDMVQTHDNGLQPLRWIGRRVVPATGSFAPIHISANTFGEHDALLLSPQHRILIRDALAELLFEDAEVLVSAKDLVNDKSVRVMEGGDVEYVHILFDAHQVVFSGGLATESFLPGPQSTASFEAEIINEICSIFPELDPETGNGYSPAARRVLKGYEAQVLMASGLAA